MKNLKFLFAMFALVVFMASCVEIDEPKGIEEVRGAKVEFLKAQAALQLAEAKLTEAKAATEQANAKLEEAYAKEIEIQNSANEAQNAFEKARLELELKKLQAQNQVEILNVQRQVAEAQQVYQEALAALAYAKAVDIPQMYMNNLENIKSQLFGVLSQISNVENNIIDRNLKLNLWIAKDSLTLDYNIRKKIADKTKALQLAKDVLATANQLKTANQSELDQQKTNITAKRQALVTERSTAEARINSLKVELVDLNKQNDNYSYQLNTKLDYTFTISVPQKIRKAVYAQFKASILFTADTTKASFTSNLSTVLNWTDQLKIYAENQKTANPTVTEWDTFLAAATSLYNGFVATQKQLIGAQNDLLITINHKSAEQTSLGNSLNTLNNYIQQYDVLLASISNNLNGLDGAIRNAQNNVNAEEEGLAGANADLAAWLKGFINDGSGSYSSVKDQYQREIVAFQNELKNLKDRFDALTKQKDALVKLINNYNK